MAKKTPKKKGSKRSKLAKRPSNKEICDFWEAYGWRKTISEFKLSPKEAQKITAKVRAKKKREEEAAKAKRKAERMKAKKPDTVGKAQPDSIKPKSEKVSKKDFRVIDGGKAVKGKSSALNRGSAKGVTKKVDASKRKTARINRARVAFGTLLKYKKACAKSQAKKIVPTEDQTIDEVIIDMAEKAVGVDKSIVIKDSNNYSVTLDYLLELNRKRDLGPQTLNEAMIVALEQVRLSK